MEQDLKKNVQRLMQIGVGDRGRLQFILDSINKEKPLFLSDQKFIESLTSKYITNNNSVDDLSEQELAKSTDMKDLVERIERLELNLQANKVSELDKKPPKPNWFFSTPPSNKIADAGLIIARLGIALTFIWAGVGKVSDPAGFGQMLQGMVGMEPAMATSMGLMIGLLELSAGVLLIAGIITRAVSAFMIVILVGGLTMFGFDLNAGPALWKDASLIGLSAMLVLYGAGRYSIDNKIASFRIHA